MTLTTALNHVTEAAKPAGDIPKDIMVMDVMDVKRLINKLFIENGTNTIHRRSDK